MDVNGWVLLSWVVFGHGFATVGRFWSWVCCRRGIWFMVLSPLVGFVMGLLLWVSFGHGSAAVYEFCSSWACRRGWVLVVGMPLWVLGLLPWIGFGHRC